MKNLVNCIELINLQIYMICLPGNIEVPNTSLTNLIQTYTVATSGDK